MINTEDSELTYLKVNSLFKQIYATSITGLVCALIVFKLLYGQIIDKYLFLWITLILVGYFGRLYLKISYEKNKMKYSSRLWLKQYHYVVSFVGGAWGCLSLITINQIPNEYEMIIVSVLLGVASGGIISNIANKNTAYFYGINIIVLYMIKVFVEQRPFYTLHIFATIFFVWFLVRMTKTFNKLYEDANSLAIDLRHKINIEKELQEEKIKSFQSSKLASLGEVAAGVAHEINNPLSVAIGRLEIIKRKIGLKDLSFEQINTQLDSVLDANRRVAKIVKSMRNLSRMKEEVELQKVNLVEILEMTAPLFENKLKRGEVQFINQLKSEKVLVDCGEISQVLLNLINNSFDAIKTKTTDKWVKLESYVDDHFITIKVSDSGNGISEDISDKLFQPFFTTKEVGEGTGLGLSLSKNIMKRNGGSLEYDNKSENTTFLMKMKKYTEN